MTQVLLDGELVTLSDYEEKTRLEKAVKNKKERAKIKYVPALALIHSLSLIFGRTFFQNQ